MRRRICVPTLLVLAGLFLAVMPTVQAEDNVPPEGFTALFNGKNTNGWEGVVEDPIKRRGIREKDLDKKINKATEAQLSHWKAVGGELHYDGSGTSLCTANEYGDFELLIDWKIEKGGDSGIYLRDTPQVQIWDPSIEVAGGVGSGGLYNNKKNPSKPLKNADKPIGEWNNFRIKMIGDKVTVHLNGELVVDNVTLENYWEPEKPVFSRGKIELQHHEHPIYFKNIFIRQIPAGEK